jgi:hypothetical protein
MAGIILWLVMSPGFSSIHHHVGRGFCREMMWSQNRDLIFKAKFMFTIIWNPSDFYVLDRLPNDIRMNSPYLVGNRLLPLIPLEQAIFPRGRALHQKRLVVHLDNCSVHISRASIDWLEEHGIRHMPHSSTLFTWSGLQWLRLVCESQRNTISISIENLILYLILGSWLAWFPMRH